MLNNIICIVLYFSVLIYIIVCCREKSFIFFSSVGMILAQIMSLAVFIIIGLIEGVDIQTYNLILSAVPVLKFIENFLFAAVVFYIATEKTADPKKETV